MRDVNYVNMANELLGDKLYSEFIQELAKEYKGNNLVDFGKEIVNKCCFLIIMIGTSKKIKLDNVKLFFGSKVVMISCQEFATKYEKYARNIENKMFEKVRNIAIN